MGICYYRNAPFAIGCYGTFQRPLVLSPHGKRDVLLSESIVQFGKYFKAMVTVLDHPAIVLDQHGKIICCNTPLVDAAHGEPGGLVGFDFADFIPNESLDPFEDFLLGPVGPGDRLFCAFQYEATQIFMVVSPLVVDGARLGFLCQSDPEHTREGARLQYLMDNLDQGIWDYDIPSETFVVSKAWRDMRGLGPDADVNRVDGTWIEEIHPEDQDGLARVFGGQTRGEDTSINIQYRRRGADGEWVWILCCAKTVEYDAEGRPARIVGTDTDVTRIRQNEEVLQHLEGKLRLAIDASGIGVWEFDANTGALHWNDKMLEMYGISGQSNDRSGDSWETYLHPDDLVATLEYSDHCQRSGEAFERDYRIIRPNGDVRYIRSRAGQIAAPGFKPKLIGVNIDVTEDYRRARELEEAKIRLEYDSRHDALTGLANRRLLDETTAEFFRRIQKDHRYAVLHLDLDYFKEINDTLGHAAGDATLVHVASVLREIIGDQGLVCRIGGDEFAILFEDAPDPETLKTLCDDVIAALNIPYVHNGQLCKFGVSIGCAYGHGPTEDRSEVFLQADTALYAAKGAGRSCYRFYRAQA